MPSHTAPLGSGARGDRAIRRNRSIRHLVGAFRTLGIKHLLCYLRSVGCVVIELLEGKPPYHFLDPMPAMFRIVQDDCPPIPDGVSPVSRILNR